MKLYCLEYDSEIQLVANAEERKVWIDWLMNKQPATIPASPYEGIRQPLPDFVHANISGFVFSKRAAAVLGQDHFASATDMAIKGYDGYRIGLISVAADKLFARHGVDYQFPLKALVPLDQIPTRFMSTGGTFTGVAGSFFVSEALWQKIETAGLTGLHLAEIYEVTSST